jgi:ATP-dependent RNA helicase RhlE
MGIAQTGTGKTAAFALPTLDHVVREERDPPKRGARVLVLAPTRELASQIAVSYRDYGSSIEGLSVACVFGGVPIHRQIKKLVHGNDVLVATPGRLIDLLGRKDVRLGNVEVLVLDEADQMMDMGFIHALKKIIPALPEQRQTLFFSATMSPQIKKLAQQFLTDPINISVAPANTTAEKVTQSLTFVDAKEKQSLLALTLLQKEVVRALVFTRTKHGANRVVKRLAAIGIEALAIHGNKSQAQRQKALAAFREGRVRFLIATDVAARGIDIEGISHVINFEIPNVPEQYVHRIGRTARASAEGQAIAFVSPDERSYLKGIQKLLKTTIPVMPLPEDFNKKSEALKSRKALPKPDKPAQPRKASKRPKRKKRPKTAEELLTDASPKKPKRQNRKAKGPRGPEKQNQKRGGASKEADAGRPDGKLKRKPKKNQKGKPRGNQDASSERSQEKTARPDNRPKNRKRRRNRRGKPAGPKS